MKKKKGKTPFERLHDTDNTLVVELAEPIVVMRKSQSSCQIKFGPKTTEVTVKVYSDEAGEAVSDALKEYERAMKKIAKISIAHRRGK